MIELVAGCTPTPTASVAPAPDETIRNTQSAVTTPTLAPSPTAQPTARPLENVVGSHWEPADLHGDDINPFAAAYGDSGAVVVGATCVGPGETPDCTASAWRQVGNGDWRAATVEDAAGASIYEVVYSDRYVALGTRIEDDGAVVRALLWESADGRTWKLLGSFAIGDCSGEGPPCGHAEGLVVSANGLMIIRDVEAMGSKPFFGAYRSTNGMS